MPGWIHTATCGKDGKWRHSALVKELAIKVHTESEVLALAKDQVVLRDKEGQEVSLAADSIVVAGPRKPVQNLVNELEYFCDELYVVGDAMIPRNLYNAIHEGYKVGVRV